MATINEREYQLCIKIMTVLLAGYTVWRQSYINYDGDLGYLAYLTAFNEVYNKKVHHDELVSVCKKLEESDQGVICGPDGAMMTSSKAKEYLEGDPKLREMALTMRAMFGNTQGG